MQIERAIKEQKTKFHPAHTLAQQREGVGYLSLDVILDKCANLLTSNEARSVTVRTKIGSKKRKIQFIFLQGPETHTLITFEQAKPVPKKPEIKTYIDIYTLDKEIKKMDRLHFESISGGKHTLVNGHTIDLDTDKDTDTYLSNLLSGEYIKSSNPSYVEAGSSTTTDQSMPIIGLVRLEHQLFNSIVDTYHTSSVAEAINPSQTPVSTLVAV